MGFLEFLQRLLKTLFGLDQEARKYREDLATAERYLRWGGDKGNLRDFERAEAFAAKLDDRNAPNPYARLRRQWVLADASLAFARGRLAETSMRIESIRKILEDEVEGYKNAASQLAELRKRVAALEAEGSLISANAERRRLGEMEHEVGDPPEKVLPRRLNEQASVLAEFQVFWADRRKTADAAREAMVNLPKLGAAERTQRDERAASAAAGIAEIQSGLDALTQALAEAFEVARASMPAQPPQEEAPAAAPAAAPAKEGAPQAPPAPSEPAAPAAPAKEGAPQAPPAPSEPAALSTPAKPVAGGAKPQAAGGAPSAQPQAPAKDAEPPPPAADKK